MQDLSDKLKQYGSFDQNGYLNITADQMIQAISYIKYTLNFRQLIDITAFRDDTLKLVYIFRDLSNNSIIYVLIPCAGTIKSIVDLYSNAELYECEIYEKFDISFVNHPKLRSIFS